MNNFVTVTINGEEVKNIAQGLPMIDALDETLDSSTLIIAPTYRKDRYQIFSQVTIKVNTITKYYYIIEDDVDVVSKQPLIYSHTVQLIEPTKLLERIHCDNLAFTQPRNSYTFPNSADIADTVTMYDVVNRIRVCAMLRRETDSREYPFNIPDTLASYLKTIPAPQFFLNDGNVKDVLNQAFRYLNAISRLTNFTDLSVDFFNEYQNLLPLEDIYNYGETQNVENYCTSLMSNMSNVTSNDAAQSTVIYPSRNAWASVRSEDGGIITTDNIMCPVESGEQEIYKFYLWVPTYYDALSHPPNKRYYYKVVIDATPFVVEKSVYDTLPLKTKWIEHKIRTEIDGIPDIETQYYTVETLGKDAALIYEYLGTNVKGLGETQQAAWLLNSSVIEVLLRYQLMLDLKVFPEEAKIPPLANRITLDNQNYSIADILYQIEYKTVRDILAEVKRIDVSDYKVTSVLKINQANNLIDAQAYGNNMVGLVQRLGNSDRILTKIIKKYEDCPNVGDYTEDGYVLTTLQKAIYNDYIVVNLGLTKNFNRRNQFIELNAETRQFLIPAKDQTLTRHSNYGEYLNIGFTPRGSLIDKCFCRLQGVNHFYEIFGNEYANINAPFTLPPIISVIKIDGVYTYARQLDSKALGNSLCYTFGFDDNRSAGITSNKNLIDENRQVQQALPFTNNGAFSKIEVELCSRFQNDGDWAPGISPEFDVADTLARQLPEVSSEVRYGTSFFDTNNNGFLVYKDPAEIWKMSYQLHFVPKKGLENRMIIGRGLTERTGLVDYAQDNFKTCLYIIDDKFSLNEINKVRGELYYTFTESDIVNKWGTGATEEEYLKLPNLPAGKSWCIGESNTGAMYFAYNPAQGEEPQTRLYLTVDVDRL